MWGALSWTLLHEMNQLSYKIISLLWIQLQTCLHRLCGSDMSQPWTMAILPLSAASAECHCCRPLRKKTLGIEYDQFVAAQKVSRQNSSMPSVGMDASIQLYMDASIQLYIIPKWQIIKGVNELMYKNVEWLSIACEGNGTVSPCGWFRGPHLVQ